MGCGPSEAFKVFDNQYLSDVSGYADMMTSEAIPMRGNKVVLAGNCINITGTSGSLVLTLEFSYDGKVWQQNTGVQVTLSAFGYTDDSAGSLDYAFVRIHAVMSSSDNTGKVLFDASLTFSHQ